MADDRHQSTGRPRFATDPDRFEAFYREHIEAVSRFIARRVIDPQMVADLTADVFTGALKGASSFDSRRGSEIGWLYGIARNVIAGELRSRERERESASRWRGRRELDADDIGRLEERIAAESTARRLGDAIAGLPDGERAVLELVAMDGLKVVDAAAALSITHATARVRLFRARRSLRAHARSAPADGEHPFPRRLVAAKE